MSDSEIDKKLDELLKIIKQAPALNGGFDKLSSAVEEIKENNTKVLYELQLVKVNQDVHTKKIEDMHKALYDPDDGLYRRVTSAINKNENQSEDLEKVVEKTELVEKSHDELARKIEIIEQKHKTLELVAGKDLQELRAAISTRKTMIRATWIFITGAAAGIIRLMWDVFTGWF